MLAPPLARAMFDRVALHRTDDAWIADAWQRGKVLAISSSSAIRIDNGHVALRDSSTAPDGPRRFLGVAGDVPYFAVTAEPAYDDTDDWQTPRQFGPQADDLEIDLAITAIALEQWHQRHPRCPRCGERTIESQAGWLRVCTADGSQHFPRTDPAVIMLIHDGDDRALLGRGRQWGPGRFSTLAGFVEPGESLESAVAREVYEEVGVEVRDIQYLASQPWPFPGSLMVGFFARLDGDSSITLDHVEMAEAGWFTRAEVDRAADWTDDLSTSMADERDAVRLRAIPPKFSISRFLIDRWLAGEN